MSALGLEEMLRRLVREEVRAALAEVLNGKEANESSEEDEIRRRAMERVAAIKSKRGAR